ncbi:type IV pilus biogenesis protein PilM [Anaeroarcus burkinensis]|uniref:type IV pilus biogenesis protein PilM n=1 Tax=Anaeroarcus burkinensis TaxID=82376 RepID=UPI0003F9987E|nr:hypothetical protein [Anaeroarcus burkinensis]
MWERMRQIWRRRKSAAVFGIDFGASHLQVAELRQTTGGPVRLRQFAIEDRPWGEKAVSSQMEGELLRDALGRNGMQAEFAVAGIGSEHSYFQVFRLPSMPERELLEAARWELQPFLKENGKHYYYDMAVLKSASSTGDTLVFAAAALKECVDWLVAAAYEAGVKLAAVEPEVVAFARANGDPGEALLVKAEAEHAHLCFVHRGIPERVETIVSEKAELSGLELAAVLTERTAAYQTLHEGCSLQSIYLGGERLAEEELGRVVAKQTGLVVQQNACWQQVTAEPLFDKTFLETAAPVLSLSIGLAMRGFQSGLR